MALLEGEEQAVRDGVKELLDLLPRIKSAADRIDSIEARTRAWVTEEVAAHLAPKSAPADESTTEAPAEEPKAE